MSTIWMGLGSSVDHSPSVTPHHRPRPDRCLIQTATWKHNSAQTQLSFHFLVFCYPGALLLMSTSEFPDLRLFLGAVSQGSNDFQKPVSLDAFKSFLSSPFHCSLLFQFFLQTTFISRHSPPFIPKSQYLNSQGYLHLNGVLKPFGI